MNSSEPGPLLESTARRLIGVLLFWSSLACVLVATLWPLRFSLAAAGLRRIDWALYYRDDLGRLIVDRDFVANLVLMSPLGAGWALLRAGRSLPRIALEAALLGFGLSAAVETVQIFEPSRAPQLADVWRNGVGCVAAALAVAWLVRRLAPRELPGEPGAARLAPDQSR